MLEKTCRLTSRQVVEQLNDVDQEDLFRGFVQTIAASGTAGCVYELSISQGQEDLGQVVGRNLSRLCQVSTQQICPPGLGCQTRQGPKRVFRSGGEHSLPLDVQVFLVARGAR